MVHPGRNIPVDRPHLISGLVFAHLIKIHALAFEHAVIGAGDCLADEAVRANLDLADFL